MNKIHHFTKNTILSFVDFFYPVVKKIMPLQTFRYAACGGANVVFGIFLYSVGYNFIFHKQVVHLGYIPFYGNLALKPFIAADYLFAIWINFATGFYLNRYVVFTESDLKKHVQLFRYLVVVVLNMVLNYYLLKLFIIEFGWYPTPAKICTTALLIVFSYFSQKHYSFKAAKI
ncbi:GtrA-like protein [mine drainage metagenome]|uniref:GtrA-like protein n=1 Tax=mine drainage metagenome TaxID=410659 RepID=A0A1J5SNK1_9ZZZZ